MIILRDPQRMIRAGARAVHGWAEENGYTVLFCAGNLALREMYEAMRDEGQVEVEEDYQNASLPSARDRAVYDHPKEFLPQFA